LIAYHSDQTPRRLGDGDRAYTRVLEVGEAVANAAELAHPFRTRALDRLLGRYAARSATDCQTAIADSVEKSRELCDVLSFPVPDLDELQNILRNASSVIEQAGNASVAG